VTGYRIALSLGIVLVLSFIVIVGLAWVYGWDELWCMHTYIDINTGQVRYRRLAGFVVVADSIESTAFSRLAAECVDEAHEPEWKRVNTDSWLTSSSPYYHYHPAIAACDTLMLVFRSFPVAEEEKYAYVRKCMIYLRNGKVQEMERLAHDAWREQEAKGK
jgi:hypothetical protein